VAACDAEEFASFLRYAKSLQFDESPNYAHLKGLFSGLMKRSGWSCDWEFDWINVSVVSLTALHDVLPTFYQFSIDGLFTFRVRRSRDEMYIGHDARMFVCVCLSVRPSPHSHTTAGTWM